MDGEKKKKRFVSRHTHTHTLLPIDRVLPLRSSKVSHQSQVNCDDASHSPVTRVCPPRIRFDGYAWHCLNDQDQNKTQLRTRNLKIMTSDSRLPHRYRTMTARIARLNIAHRFPRILVSFCPSSRFRLVHLTTEGSSRIILPAGLGTAVALGERLRRGSPQ